MNVSVELLQSSFLMSEIQYFYVFCHNGCSSRRRCNSTGAAIYGQRVELFGILQVCVCCQILLMPSSFPSNHLVCGVLYIAA